MATTEPIPAARRQQQREALNECAAHIDQAIERAKRAHFAGAEGADEVWDSLEMTRADLASQLDKGE